MRLFLLLTALPLALFGDALRITVDNHEEELRSFEERLVNQEVIMDSLRSLIQEAGAQQKNQTSALSNAQERQIKALQDRIIELEKKTMAQAHQINLLQDALKTFIDSFHTSTVPSAEFSPSMIYVVKNGDSLGKIARAYHTTSHILRDMNNLSGDKIIIGQKLRVPEQ